MDFRVLQKFNAHETGYSAKDKIEISIEYVRE